LALAVIFALTRVGVDASSAVRAATGLLAGTRRGAGCADARAALIRHVGVSNYTTARGGTVAQLAVAWVLANPAVQVAIVGSRTPAHLEESTGALGLSLSQDDLAEIDSIMSAGVPVGGPASEGMA
jgi:hypothetical protein